jgi:L-ascorbate metabolism protein UlaG (beta-lactamase superfamily)
MLRSNAMYRKNKRIFFVVIFICLNFITLSTALAFDLQWYGQSAFKIKTPGGKVILIDPFITNNPKTPENLKDLEKIGNIDLILVTHGHGDHVGDTAQLSEKTGAKVAMNADMGHTFAALGWVPYERLIGFNKSGPIMPIGENIKITMVHAEHSSEVVHTDSVSKKKSVHPGGEPAGYIIELENGYKIYHAGDTGVFTDMRMISELYNPNLVMLPIGGHYTMDPEHAAYAVKNFFKESKIIPMHYGTFPPLKGTPEEFKNHLQGVSTEVIVMNPGETRSM